MRSLGANQQRTHVGAIPRGARVPPRSVSPRTSRPISRAQATPDDVPVSAPVVVTAAAALMIAAPAFAGDRLLTPEQPGYLRAVRENPELYGVGIAAEAPAAPTTVAVPKESPTTPATVAVTKNPPAVKAEATKAEKPKPAAKAEKPKPAAKAEKPKSKPAAQGPKPPSLMPKPSKPAPKPAKEKKETFKSGNAEVVKKDTGLSPGIIVGGLATLAFLSGTRDNSFDPNVKSTAAPKTKPKVAPKPSASSTADADAVAKANAADAQDWIDSWKESNSGEAMAAEANAAEAQGWIDAWSSGVKTTTASAEPQTTDPEDAAKANAAEAQAWIDAWSAGVQSSANAKDAQGWIDAWKKDGKSAPKDGESKEEKKGFLSKVFGFFKKN